MQEYHIRAAGKRDVPFITSSWLRSFRDGPMVRGVPNTFYYRYHHKIMEQLLPRSFVFCAVNSDDPDQILAWICAELVDSAAVVHYIYVKQAFRKFGIAKALYSSFLSTVEANNQARPEVTFWTHKSQKVKKLRNDAKMWIYNPYLALMTIPENWYRPDGKYEENTEDSV